MKCIFAQNRGNLPLISPIFPYFIRSISQNNNIRLYKSILGKVLSILCACVIANTLPIDVRPNAHGSFVHHSPIFLDFRKNSI